MRVRNLTPRRLALFRVKSSTGRRESDRSVLLAGRSKIVKPCPVGPRVSVCATSFLTCRAACRPNQRNVYRREFIENRAHPGGYLAGDAQIGKPYVTPRGTPTSGVGRPLLISSNPASRRSRSNAIREKTRISSPSPPRRETEVIEYFPAAVSSPVYEDRMSAEIDDFIPVRFGKCSSVFSAIVSGTVRIKAPPGLRSRKQFWNAGATGGFTCSNTSEAGGSRECRKLFRRICDIELRFLVIESIAIPKLGPRGVWSSASHHSSRCRSGRDDSESQGCSGSVRKARPKARTRQLAIERWTRSWCSFPPRAVAPTPEPCNPSRIDCR